MAASMCQPIGSTLNMFVIENAQRYECLPLAICTNAAFDQAPDSGVGASSIAAAERTLATLVDAW